MLNTVELASKASECDGVGAYGLNWLAVNTYSAPADAVGDAVGAAIRHNCASLLARSSMPINDGVGAFLAHVADAAGPEALRDLADAAEHRMFTPPQSRIACLLPVA